MAEHFERKLPFKDVVFVGSPQYISVAHFPDGAVPQAGSFTCQVFAWRGLKASPPVNPNYTLFQKATPFDNTVDPLETFATFEVSSLIAEVFDVRYNSLNDSGLQNAVWFQIIITVDSSAMTYDSGVHLATLGWGEFLDNENPGLAYTDLNEVIIGLSSSITASTLRAKLYAVYVGEFTTNESLDINGGMDVFFTGTGSTHSDRQFKVYSSVELIAECGKTTLRLQFDPGTTSYNVNGVNTKDQNIEVIYLGKVGVQTSISMLGRSDIRERKTQTTYNNITIDGQPTFGTADPMSIYNPLLPQKKTATRNTRNDITVHSGIVQAVEISMYTELFRSEYIWLNIDGDVFPVTIKDTNFSPKNLIYDKLQEFSFTFEFANPTINQVV